ncbi:hypothetical protein AAF712_016395 [Marasmius tenuissimus]|uniref:Nephrocystin 3-like N-terminal domain-containing protein n=1 Tax=Marasmius tenuissimus TaxID=585030 RepID=A0ABR2Z810_9AGAR
MTIAKSAQDSGLVESFFFFRSDPRRNNLSAFVLVIAHGLVRSDPSLRRIIEQRIADDPQILEASMEDQFRELIQDPVSKAYKRGGWRNRIQRISGSINSGPSDLVILDGLDECGDEDTQLRLLFTIASSYQQDPSFPLRFLVSCRPESWLRKAFSSEHLGTITETFVLDDSYLANEDIRKYYRHIFGETRKKSQHLPAQLPDQWPSVKDLETLVQKTSSEFAYAATAVRFINLENSSPIEQLRIILDSTPDRDSSELDCLYKVIISANPEHNTVLPILSAILLMPPPRSPDFIELLLELPKGKVKARLQYMSPVLTGLPDKKEAKEGLHMVRHDPRTEHRSRGLFWRVSNYLHLRPRDGPLSAQSSSQHRDSAIDSSSLRDEEESIDEITISHTSFLEFIHDPSRSGIFYIDPVTQYEALAVQWLRVLSQQVKASPNILLNPEPRPENTRKVSGIQRLLSGWVPFCITNRQATSEVLLKGDDFLQSILSTFPDRQQLYTTLASLILLPAHANDPSQSQELKDLVLGPDQGRIAHSIVRSLQACRLVTSKANLEPFFLTFLCYPSREYSLDIPKQRDLLARRWIQALKPSSQPISNPDHWALQKLWEGWADFCSGIKRPSRDLLSELQTLDLRTVQASMIDTHGRNTEAAQSATRAFEAIVFWLESVDASVPTELVDRFKEAAK